MEVRDNGGPGPAQVGYSPALRVGGVFTAASTWHSVAHVESGVFLAARCNNVASCINAIEESTTGGLPVQSRSVRHV